MFEAKKRFGLIIFNFTITSNHIHLYELKEPQNPYTPLFAPEKSCLSLKNEYVWKVF